MTLVGTGRPNTHTLEGSVAFRTKRNTTIWPCKCSVSLQLQSTLERPGEQRKKKSKAGEMAQDEALSDAEESIWSECSQFWTQLLRPSTEDSWHMALSLLIWRGRTPGTFNRSEPLLFLIMHSNTSVNVWSNLTAVQQWKGATAPAGDSKLPFPGATLTSSDWGIPRALPGHCGDIISPPSPGSSPWPPPNLVVPGTPP